MGIWEAVKSVFRTGETDRTEVLLRELQGKLNYTFHDVDLLRVALTHRSFAKAGEKDWLPSNERLEFLGDSVLGLVVAEFLFHEYPDKLEGGLTKFKSLLVNETSLFRTAREIDLGKYILLSPEEDRAGGRDRPSINADTFEALVGALYLDGGLGIVKPFIKRRLLSKAESVAADQSIRNFKGELLEYLQGRAEGMPRYEVVDEDGPDHDKIFTVEVYSNGAKIGSGSGSSKKDAEQKAAAMALEKLKSG